MTIKTKVLSIGLIFAMVLSLTACNNTEKTLYKNGMEVISLMDEMVNSDEYIDIVLPNSDGVREYVKHMQEGDYSEVKNLYKLETPEDAPWLEIYEDIDTSDMSDELKKHVERMMISSIPTNITVRAMGADALGASSLFVATKSFKGKSIKESVMYLYTFKSGYDIIVTFTPAENGMVSASGRFLIVENTKDVLESMGIEMEKIAID